MSKLHISDSLSLPIEAVTQTFGIVGKKRSGKSSTSVVMAEEFLKQNIAPVIVDPLDVYWGLKSGYPIYIFGGPHQDAPLEPTAGELMADIMVDERVPMILSLKHFDSDAAQGRFVTAFCQRALKRNKYPVPVIFDEADKFAPQRPMPGEQVMLGAVDRFVRHGGVSGLGTTLITQRPALINKNVLNQIDTMVIHRLVGPTDVDAIEQWIKRHGTKEECEKILASLPTLGTGEAWVYSPEWLEVLKRVQIRKKETFDSSRTPKVGERVSAPKNLATVDIDKLGEKIKATVERAKADDPKALRAEIAALKKQVGTAKPTVETKIERVEVFPKAAALKLKSFAKNISATLKTVDGWAAEVIEIVDKCESSNKVYGSAAIAHPAFVAEQDRRNLAMSKKVDQVLTPSNGTIAKGERSVLIALAQYPEGCARDQITILTGYKRSTRDAYIQRLIGRGYANIGNGVVLATDEGVTALGDDYEPLPTGFDLQQYWLQRLPEGERKILKELVWSGRKTIDRDTLTEKTGYMRSTRDAYIQRLKARRLVDVSREGVTASETLFE